jgi:hypothetical protein
MKPMSPRRAVAVYPLPGLSARAGEYVVGLVMEEFRDWDRGRGRPRSVSAVEVLGMTLRHLRRNATYVDLSEDYGVAPSTAWGYVNEMTRFLADVLGSTRAGLKAAVAGKVCLVDGSLVPVLSWRHRPDLCSGEHLRYGVNIQVVTDLHGRLIGVSRAFPGARHDRWCFEEAATADLLAASAGDAADSGYQGSGPWSSPTPGACSPSPKPWSARSTAPPPQHPARPSTRAGLSAARPSAARHSAAGHHAVTPRRYTTETSPPDIPPSQALAILALLADRPVATDIWYPLFLVVTTCDATACRPGVDAPSAHDYVRGTRVIREARAAKRSLHDEQPGFTMSKSYGGK